MDVKLLRLTTGEDVVAELVYADPSITTIKKPFVLIPMAQNPGSNAETKLYWCNRTSWEKDYIMTDKKDDNIIVGPWTGEPVDNNADWIKKKYDKALEKNTTQLKMEDKLAKIEILTENIMVQLIHTLSEKGYDI